MCTAAVQQKQPAFRLANRSSMESANYILQQPAFPLIWTALGGLRFSLARTCIGSSDYSLKGGFDDT
jgi:hypothetical protein